jgi:hypothetical protein
MTKRKTETVEVLINNMNDLLKFTKQLLDNIGDFGQYSKAIHFLNELREEYRFWMGEHYKVELRFSLMLHYNEFRLFQVTMPKKEWKGV